LNGGLNGSSSEVRDTTGDIKMYQGSKPPDVALLTLFNSIQGKQDSRFPANLLTVAFMKVQHFKHSLEPVQQVRMSS